MRVAVCDDLSFYAHIILVIFTALFRSIFFQAKLIKVEPKIKDNIEAASASFAFTLVISVILKSLCLGVWLFVVHMLQKTMQKEGDISTESHFFYSKLINSKIQM